jgi:hypothetical protein
VLRSDPRVSDRSSEDRQKDLTKNSKDVLFRAFQLRADVIVHREDETVPSPDALRYFDWEVRELLVPDVKSSDGHQILRHRATTNRSRSPALIKAIRVRPARSGRLGAGLWFAAASYG